MAMRVGMANSKVDIYKLHEKLTQHMFAPYSDADRCFLALALAGEVGELCNRMKKDWRDRTEHDFECREELADIRIYLELLAKCFNVEGAKLNELVNKKLATVVLTRWPHLLNDVVEEDANAAAE
ncbi:MAG TPA: hypothetical protein VF760_00610 [Xanthobacteraceae bacterium]